MAQKTLKYLLAALIFFVLHSYKYAIFVGKNFLRKTKFISISFPTKKTYFLQRPTILQYFLQSHNNVHIHITY